MSSDQTNSKCNNSGVSSPSPWKNLWSIEECLEQLNKNPETIQFVDATWFMGGGGRDGRKEFEDGPRLPGAFHWDTDDLSLSNSEVFPDANPLGLACVFPPKWLVGAALEAMGVTTTNTPTPTTLVVYGKKGTMFAPRVWCLLKRYYRFGTVKILHGSLEDWMVKGGPVDEGPLGKKSITARDLMTTTSNNEEHPLILPNAKDRLVDKEFVLGVLKENNNSNTMQPVIIDVRGPAGFANGHIPSSLNLPFANLTLPDDRLILKPRDELESILRTFLGAEQFKSLTQRPVLLTCGAAISLCTLDLVLDELGFPQPYIYDGSWQDWSQDSSTPKETGEL